VLPSGNTAAHDVPRGIYSARARLPQPLDRQRC
jgi:hypothetical protein